MPSFPQILGKGECLMVVGRARAFWVLGHERGAERNPAVLHHVRGHEAQDIAILGEDHFVGDLHGDSF